MVRIFLQNLERLEYGMLMDMSQFSSFFIPNLNPAIGISCTHKLPIYANRGSVKVNCVEADNNHCICYLHAGLWDLVGSRIIPVMGKSALANCSCISGVKLWKRSCFLKFHSAWLTAQFCRLGRFSIIIFL